MAYKKSDFTKEYYQPQEVAALLGVTSRTVANYCLSGLMKDERTEGGRRRIERESLLSYLEHKGMLVIDNAQRRDVVYARVSTHAQATRGDLDRQIQEVSSYAALCNPVNLEVIKEIGSGLNDNRKQFNSLLKAVLNKEVGRIFINYKDRLTRFGFKYIELICSHAGTEIITVSNEVKQKSVQEELAEDLCAIIHSFSGKLYGMRGKDKSKILDKIEAIRIIPDWEDE
jgi:putative resolvase